jgi:hypothetical protein
VHAYLELAQKRAVSSGFNFRAQTPTESSSRLPTLPRMLSPPKYMYPSAANVGMVVRDFGGPVPRNVAPSTDGSLVHDTIPFGITCGVNWPCPTLALPIQRARAHDPLMLSDSPPGPRAVDQGTGGFPDIP